MGNLKYLIRTSTRLLEELDFCTNDVVGMSADRIIDGKWRVKIHLSRKVDMDYLATTLNEELKDTRFNDKDDKIFFTHDGIEYFQLKASEQVA